MYHHFSNFCITVFANTGVHTSSSASDRIVSVTSLLPVSVIYYVCQMFHHKERILFRFNSHGINIRVKQARATSCFCSCACSDEGYGIVVKMSVFAGKSAYVGI